MSLLSDFIREIDDFLATNEMAPTAFGMAVFGDPNFVGDLRNGRHPNLRTIEKAREYMHPPRRRQGSRTGAAA
jgi:hypothetical protein